MSQTLSQISITRIPASYHHFIERAYGLASERGISWHIQCDELGKISSNEDWDIRRFSSNNERHAARLTSFSIDEEVRSRASQAGWPEVLLPSGPALSEITQEFLKAIVAHRASEGILPRSVRNEFSLLKSFFSCTNKYPWELNSEDLDRYLDLFPKRTSVRASIGVLAGFLNSNLLSLHVPLVYKGEKELNSILSNMLSERKGSKKLPSAEALHEMVRIVFNESPLGHQHKIRFAIARMLTLTGLRLNEVVLLPADCLQWETHIDIVTGKPAGEIGGVSRSLKIKYFGEKRRKKGDKVLVEDFQWVPARFAKLVELTVLEILEATRPLRDAIKSQNSVERTFTTASGEQLTIGDFLFLVLHNCRGDLPEFIDSTRKIEIAAQSSFLAF
ncbi:hypothetical protein [Massilia putida]|uniref:hypothetical protein n=1 Tax=Massilia putida TaxID=1141883 RepID=UPI0012EBCAF3|nr:hypothetical protein [Massilia putida]